MKLILGLGNPGEKYEKTRHNFGFRALDEFQQKNEFPDWKLDKKFRAEITEKKIRNEKVFLVKPQTFMNLSGEAARAILDFYKPSLEDFIIAYDDVDLPFGKIRIREGGSSGGHNGIKSLIQHFGTENFARLRLGIATELLDLVPTEEFVLSKFSKDEEKEIVEIIDRAISCIEEFVKNGVAAAMNRFN